MSCLGPAAPCLAAQPLQDENILVTVPVGFIVAERVQKGAATIAKYIPQGETPLAWSRMVTVQVFHQLKDLDPEIYAAGLRSQWLSNCAGSQVQDVKDGQENGYPFAIVLFTCPMDTRTQKPENMFAKFIGGSDSFYSVQYAYRSALTKAMLPPTMDYLRAVKACDTRIAARACPVLAP
ncbi:MAG: hypothetical protein ACYDD1_13855 [Caulobacteraceae bacterium]